MSGERDEVDSEEISRLSAELAEDLGLTTPAGEGDAQTSGEGGGKATEGDATGKSAQKQAGSAEATRNADGTFKAKEGADSKPGETAAAAPAPGTSSTGAKAEGGAASQATASAPSLDNPPKAWGIKTAEAWKTLPEPIRAEIAKRESDLQTGFEKYRQLAEFGDGFRQAALPFNQIFQQYGINPIQHANRLFNIHASLALGTPEQKLNTFRGLMKEFGIPAEALTVDGAGQAPHLDPQVSALTSRFDQLQSSVTRMTEAQTQSAIERVTREVSDFAAKNKYYPEVEQQIARLLETKACSTLQDAYDQACWSNPVVREKMLAETRAAQDEATRKQREAEAAKARQSSAANVRSSPKSRGPAAQKGSIDETLNAVADRMFAEQR